MTDNTKKNAANDTQRSRTSILFTRDTVQPITLLELGKHLSQPWGNHVTACELGYERAFDVYTQTTLSLEDTTLNPGVESRAYGWPLTEAATKRGEHDYHRFRGAYTIFLDENKPQEEQDFLNLTRKYATIIAREMIAKREGRTIKQLTRVTADPAQFN